MTKDQIEALIGILENRMNEAESTMERFTLFQEIKSLQLQLDSMVDNVPAFWVFQDKGE